MKPESYFTLKELIKSEIAVTNQIKNEPDIEAAYWLGVIRVKILDAIRGKLGFPIRILSGYRSPVINRMAGGVGESYHMKGQAIDIAPLSGNISELHSIFTFVVSELNFDQIIYYKKRNFIHISYCETNRKEIIIKE